MEESRVTEGYEIDTFISAHDNLRNATKIKLTIQEEELMKFFFAPAARIIQLNKKWKRGVGDGFDIGAKSGFFKTKKQVDNSKADDPVKNVMLYTDDTSDILYVQPVKALGLTEAGVITMQFALEKAIEQIYNIESKEITAIPMGSEENKNIMLYESAEGSIGVLKDIARNPAILKDIFRKAYEICGYDYNTKEDVFPERPKASYDDLLSYYNQQYHAVIDRHAIIYALDQLISSQPDNTQNGTYEEHYHTLLDGLNSHSPGEKQLLDFLFNNGYGLPDYTNYNLKGFYIQPDFVFEKEKVLIFVDGGIHKNGVVKAKDERDRKILEKSGYDVLVWDYTSENVLSFITQRKDIFRKVR